MDTQFVVNESGKKVNVILPYKKYKIFLKYEKIIEEIELQDDIDFASNISEKDIETMPAKYLWNE